MACRTRPACRVLSNGPPSRSPRRRRKSATGPVSGSSIACQRSRYSDDSVITVRNRRHGSPGLASSNTSQEKTRARTVTTSPSSGAFSSASVISSAARSNSGTTTSSLTAKCR
ncbi:hypothetical protein DMH08_01175 [Actinomadura sp. WAC 06369]|nr:hypothetical protein DMH08_01175 [Actinomadura sp. WAC 06369]